MTLLAANRVAWSVFDHVAHLEDELAFLFQARTLAAGRLVADAPALPQFFQLPFLLIREDMWFGKYPPGFPAVLALGALAGDPWLTNAVAGAACVALIYLAGRRLYGAGTGLVAAALLTISPLFLLHLGTVMSHVVSLVWALVMLVLFAVTRRGRHPLAALGIGAAAGALFLTRPLTAVGIGLPFAVWALADLLGRRPQARAIPLMALGFVPFALAFLGYNWLTTGAPLLSAYEVYWPHDRLGLGEGRDTDGLFTLDEAIGRTRENLDELTMYLFGWPLRLSLVPAGLAALALIAEGGRRLVGRGRGVAQPYPLPPGAGSEVTEARRPARRVHPAAWDLLLAGIVVCLIGVYFFYWAANSVYGPRYYFEALGAFVLLSARGLRHMARLALSVLKWARPAWPGAPALAVVVVALVAGGLSLAGFQDFVPRAFDKHRNWYTVDGADLRRVEAAGLQRALVFVPGADWVDYAPFLSQNSPRLDDDVLYARDLGEALNRELMTLYPGRAYYRYADGALHQLAP